ncbi:MAG: DUF4010 domain-containing protein [Pseudomonadota bacterium]
MNPPPAWLTPWTALLAALAVGLIIGLERGWREREAAEGGRVAGLRTFGLVGLLGGVLGSLFEQAGPWPIAAGLLGLALLNAQAYREGVHASGNLSATSAIAQFVTFSLGVLAALGQPVPAVAVAVLVAVLLSLRTTLHQGLRLIERGELSAALQMLVLSVVVLPLLPDAGYGPYGALNPYRLWWAVVLVAGLSLSGHVAMRVAGEQRGTLWTGLLGGLASSTAATLALARRCREQPALAQAAAAGALSACAVMFLRIAVVALTFAPSLGRLLLPMLLATGLALFGAGLLCWRRRSPDDGVALPGVDIAPFDLTAALGFGAYLGVTAVLLEAGREWLGASALYGLSLLAGLADVDAITISLARLHAAGSTAETVAATAIGLAVLSNMLAKAVMAWVSGGAVFGRLVAGGYAVSLAAGAVAFAAFVA